MPHTDVEKALELVLSLDIPFWPQLPKLSFYEDMYAQSSQNFPGIVIEPENAKVVLDNARFEKELVITSHGQPVAVIVPVTGEGLEDKLQAIRQAEFQQTIGRIQRRSVRRGTDNLTAKEIDAEVARARKARK